MPDTPPTDALNISKEGAVTFIKVSGSFEKIDYLVDQQIGGAIVTAADGASPPLVVVDLSNMNFFSSAFVATLFHAWRKLRAKTGSRFGICGLTPFCRTVLMTSRLDELWQLFDSRADALSAWASAN